MSRKTISNALSLIIIVMWSPMLFSDQSPTFLSEPSGAFKYVIPKGWTISEAPGFKFKVAFGSPSRGFSPNICVVDETFSGTLDEYVSAGMKLVEKVTPGFKMIERSPFKTDSGIVGIKLVAESTHGDKHLVQSQYYFKGIGGKMLVLTCSVLYEDRQKFADTSTLR